MMKQFGLSNLIVVFMIASMLVIVATRRVNTVRVDMTGFPTLFVYESASWGWPAVFKKAQGPTYDLRTDFPNDPFLDVLEKGIVNVTKDEYDRLLPRYSIDHLISSKGEEASIFEEFEFHIHLLVLDIVLVAFIPSISISFLIIWSQKLLRRKSTGIRCSCLVF